MYSLYCSSREVALHDYDAILFLQEKRPHNNNSRKAVSSFFFRFKSTTTNKLKQSFQWFVVAYIEPKSEMVVDKCNDVAWCPSHRVR